MKTITCHQPKPKDFKNRLMVPFRQ